MSNTWYIITFGARKTGRYPAILHANRQLRTEALPVFYGKATFICPPPGNALRLDLLTEVIRQ